ncbi:sigma-54-dependent Fis family transcriptional regulator [Thermosulfuriphilus ammonigenes]|uniref:Sigma-54-dependent Fis family transcriptional regulator n=1 Tax=Thermosulfuriphilus ammonigenes TaxID=1936021 RepID=A0A6G7PXH0_9BACT|nr:sigma-54 dependent transcriptional regulator [Thermosulfuriphilus ammonigenes]MBA2849585.1 DNA-binding NtrC family response regulator [Thermosulfuriphilus ammonigenes]QIJ72310.1 sigma-54-dependent Fis family transcriptional regulator [Thermosulfuriphilus ammonigenes]
MTDLSEKGRILVVDDEEIALKNLEYILQKLGHEIVATTSSLKARDLLKKETFDVVVTDLKMEKVDGMELLRLAKERSPESEVIIITAFATVDSAIEAMKAGAYYYIAKPYKIDEVRKVVSEALEKTRLRRENLALRRQLEAIKGRVKILTNDAKMKQILDVARQVAISDCTVLITGESGTGKELLARYIHEMSPRRQKPFVVVNCGVFTEELLAHELFGHEKGAFTGATHSKKGLVDMANGGTLFLDEIAEMSPSMQVKLLRLIQEHEFYRVGGTEPIRVDIRFIAATNQDLKKAVERGDFRLDLYYRLNVVNMHLPPLAERKGDIPLLARFFLEKHAARMGKKVTSISQEVIAILKNYDFPGNVRELENIIERGVALATGETIDSSCLPEEIRQLDIKAFRKKDGRYPTLEEQEIAYIRWILKETGGNKTLAAQILGIDRVSLWRKLKKYGLEAEK